MVPNKVAEILISILRSELTGTEEVNLSNICLEELLKVYQLSKTHNVYSMCGDYLLRHGIEDEDIYQDLVLSQLVVEMEEDLLNRAMGVLEKAGFVCVPLKGAVIRNYYPKPWMRLSGDIDILVKESDWENAKRLLCESLHLGAGRVESELVSEQGIIIDLGKSILDRNHRDGKGSNLADIWEYVIENASGTKTLRDDMQYVYSLEHMARHFDNGGCGINHVMDLWVLNHLVMKNDAINKARNALLIEKKDKDLEENFNQIAEKWFSSSYTSNTNGIERLIIEGGAQGTRENKLSMNRGRYGTLMYKLKKMFVPYSYLCILFPSLTGKRWLTPIYEVFRWIYHLRKGRFGIVLREFKAVDSIPDDEMRSISTSLKNTNI